MSDFDLAPTFVSAHKVPEGKPRFTNLCPLITSVDVLPDPFSLSSLSSPPQDTNPSANNEQKNKVFNFIAI